MRSETTIKALNYLKEMKEEFGLGKIIKIIKILYYL